MKKKAEDNQRYRNGMIVKQESNPEAQHPVNRAVWGFDNLLHSMEHNTHQYYAVDEGFAVNALRGVRLPSPSQQVSARRRAHSTTVMNNSLREQLITFLSGIRGISNPREMGYWVMLNRSQIDEMLTQLQELPKCPKCHQDITPDQCTTLVMEPNMRIERQLFHEDCYVAKVIGENQRFMREHRLVK